MARGLPGFLSPSGDVGAEVTEVCLPVQVDGSAGFRAFFLVCVGLCPGDVTPTPMPAIEPCLGVGGKSTSSKLRIGGGGVAVLVCLAVVGLTVRLPSSAAITSRRSSSRAASRLCGGGRGAGARVREEGRRGADMVRTIELAEQHLRLVSGTPWTIYFSLHSTWKSSFDFEAAARFELPTGS